MIEELFHQAALLPLTVLLILRLRSMKVDAWHWGLAAAFSISWVADTAADFMPGNTWLVSYIYPPIQLGIVYTLLLEKKLIPFVFGGLALLWIATVSQNPDVDSPEVVLRVSNGFFIAALAHQRPDLRISRLSILTYFGLGSFFQLLFPWVMDRPDMFLLDWYAYQGCRMVGLALASVDIFANRRPHLSLE